jgi:hypothetical protein
MSDPDLIYVEWKRSGGQIPTLRPAVRLAAQDLSSAERAELERLIQSADLANQPARFPGKRAPDSFEHQLTVHSTNETRTLVFHDQDGHPQSVDALVAWIRSRQKS